MRLSYPIQRQDLVNQQGRTLSHPPRSAARAKAAPFAAEGNQMLGVAGLAAHPQKTVFQPEAVPRRHPWYPKHAERRAQLDDCLPCCLPSP